MEAWETSQQLPRTKCFRLRSCLTTSTATMRAEVYSCFQFQPWRNKSRKIFFWSNISANVIFLRCTTTKKRTSKTKHVLEKFTLRQIKAFQQTAQKVSPWTTLQLWRGLDWSRCTKMTSIKTAAHFLHHFYGNFVPVKKTQRSLAHR